MAFYLTKKTFAGAKRVNRAKAGHRKGVVAEIQRKVASNTHAVLMTASRVCLFLGI